jgi:hypothetical protein
MLISVRPPASIVVVLIALHLLRSSHAFRAFAAAIVVVAMVLLIIVAWGYMEIGRAHRTYEADMARACADVPWGEGKECADWRAAHRH